MEDGGGYEWFGWDGVSKSSRVSIGVRTARVIGSAGVGTSVSAVSKLSIRLDSSFFKPEEGGSYCPMITFKLLFTFYFIFYILYWLLMI